MTAVSAASSTMINPSFTTVFQNGAWSALTMVGANDNAAGGGGVTAIANDEGLAVVAAASGASLESVWTGAWPQLYQIDPSDDIFVSGPVAASPGAFVAEEASLSPYPITLDTFNESGPTWTTGELTGANGDGRCIPVVAATQAGEPLVLYSTTVSGTGERRVERACERARRRGARGRLGHRVGRRGDEGRHGPNRRRLRHGRPDGVRARVVDVLGGRLVDDVARRRHRHRHLRRRDTHVGGRAA
jgi:hypothetical protein